MLERLERSFRTQQRFIANASHELRSPLANLRLALELPLRRLRTPEAYQQALQSALDEVDRLTRLVQDLLTLGRADSGRLPVAFSPVALRALLEELLNAYALQAQTKGIKLVLEVPDVIVAGDSSHLSQLFTNLLDNALRHTPASGAVTLTGARQDGCVEVAVHDTGEGIAPEHLPHVFERFYRVDPERTPGDGGTGLGLAICQEIVRAYRGGLTVDSTVGHGSTFTVTLPLTPPEVNS
jgi:signal transduction histidine kinase